VTFIVKVNVIFGSAVAGGSSKSKCTIWWLGVVVKVIVLFFIVKENVLFGSAVAGGQLCSPMVKIKN
jgi:hypothetical protein